MSMLDQVLGARLIGVLFATFLQGLLTLQMYYYFVHERKDSWMTKLLVFTTWALDLLQLVLLSHAVYHYTITNWGNPIALPFATWQLNSHLIVTGLASFLCQCFFLHRLYILSGKPLLVLFPLVLAVTSIVLDIVISTKILRFLAFSDLKRYTPEVVARFSITAATDSIIAILLCFYLYRHSQNSTFPNTQRLLRKIIQYTITTGLLTSIVAIVSLVLFVLYDSTAVFTIPFVSLGSLYTNSLLASLNMRQALSPSRDVEASYNVQTSGSSGSSPRMQSHPKSVHISVDKMLHSAISDDQSDLASTTK